MRARTTADGMDAAEAGPAGEGPVPAPLVARALARLGDAGDLLHDVLAPEHLGPASRLPDDVRLVLGEALEGLARAERLLQVGLSGGR